MERPTANGRARDIRRNGKQILRYANGTSALMMTTPNTLFEVDFDLGIPFLWGRCPAE
ncbi:hypothetical protein MES4922_290015 [Mesorhizobium ventifaucium]|uniref:Uncharacterized protein n=1 Tax=Mesorhizobium ventifaucium TaxID=666020 RepID=A0ABM9DWH4_9HYPH|nr:hypothetical protein MES4922_290015 [Mesorhizobium ventifaucium]